MLLKNICSDDPAVIKYNGFNNSPLEMTEILQKQLDECLQWEKFTPLEVQDERVASGRGNPGRRNIPKPVEEKIFEDYEKGTDGLHKLAYNVGRNLRPKAVTMQDQNNKQLRGSAS